MSQLSDWKRAHLMCTENHVCFGRVHGSQLREGANAGQHTPTLSLPYVRTMVLQYYTTPEQEPQNSPTVTDETAGDTKSGSNVPTLLQ